MTTTKSAADRIAELERENAELKAQIVNLTNSVVEKATRIMWLEDDLTKALRGDIAAARKAAGR